MTRLFTVAALVGLTVTPLIAGRDHVSGSYVEARTAEVFTGGCIMGSEAGTVGKEAVLAWKLDTGSSFNGALLGGFSVVAVVAGDRNLGIQEIGGGKSTTRSVIYVDQRANTIQQMALASMVHAVTKGLEGIIVDVRSAPITFDDTTKSVHVATTQVALDVSKEMSHDPTCGAMQWFHPLASVTQATVGVTDQNSFSGAGLGTKWSDPNRRSAFFGTFAY